MVELSRILCPVDFSDNSQLALDYALSLAVIVMGVMGRSGADLFFFGTTTNHIVRAAHCPVLTVRAEE